MPRPLGATENCPRARCHTTALQRQTMLFYRSVEADTSTSGTLLVQLYSYSFLPALGKMLLAMLRKASHWTKGVGDVWHEGARTSRSTVHSQACMCRYCFSLYSSQLKQHFGYSQEEIQGIGSANNLGQRHCSLHISCFTTSQP